MTDFVRVTVNRPEPPPPVSVDIRMPHDTARALVSVLRRVGGSDGPGQPRHDLSRLLSALESAGVVRLDETRHSVDGSVFLRDKLHGQSWASIERVA